MAIEELRQTAQNYMRRATNRDLTNTSHILLYVACEDGVWLVWEKWKALFRQEM